MKALMGRIILIGLVAILLVPGIYGMYLAFKVSIAFGVVACIVQPSPTIIGWIGLFGHPEVAGKLAAWIGLN